MQTISAIDNARLFGPVLITRKRYKTCDDIKIEDIVAAHRNSVHLRRVSRAYAEGDFDLGVVMDEQGVTERQARNILAREAQERAQQQNDPAEYEFQTGVMADLKRNLKRYLRDGRISFDEIQASPTPPRKLDITVEQWRRVQAYVRDNAPWNTAGQKAAYERGFREHQRAEAACVFGTFTPKKRVEHWERWWRHETPAGWWQEGPVAWTVHRAELARQIERDARAAA